MNEKELREYIATRIEDYADSGYQGALASDDPYILSTATYINSALVEAARIARED